MKSARILLVTFLALFAFAALADNPKAGVYTAEKDGSTGELHFSKRGDHFQVQGKLKFRVGEFNVKGTLFTTTWKFKGTANGKDVRTGKVKDHPVNGNWNHRSGSLTLYFPGGYMDFHQEKMERDGKEPDFTGTWETSFGKMTLTQSGSKVSGTYDYYGGTIDGEIKGDDQLYFKWTQTNDKRGTGVFKLGIGGATFSGWWDYTLSTGKPANNGGGWSGKRIK